MNDFEIKKELLNEIRELANNKCGNELSYVWLWGSASSILTSKQLKIIKTVLENK
jgi:hypothetical protein